MYRLVICGLVFAQADMLRQAILDVMKNTQYIQGLSIVIREEKCADQHIEVHGPEDSELLDILASLNIEVRRIGVVDFRPKKRPGEDIVLQLVRKK